VTDRNKIDLHPNAHPSWYRLDTAAILYPSIEKQAHPCVFRISVSLSAPVEPELLRKALNQVLDRFPTLKVRMTKGFFWYFLEPNGKPPLIHQDAGYPCMRINREDNNGYLFRVMHGGSRIAVEFYHALTDGMGSLVFLKTLAAQYLRLKGADIPFSGDILDWTRPPEAEELEDAFIRHYTNSVKGRSIEGAAYHITGTPEPVPVLNTVTGLVPMADVKKKAGDFKVSVTDLFVALYLSALYTLQKREKMNRRKPIRVSVPVNLRTVFPSGTLRNFSSYVKPGIEPKMGEHTFADIVILVHHAMLYEMHPLRLGAIFGQNVRNGLHPVLSHIPLFLKNLLISFFYNNFVETLFSGALSNIGLVTLPDGMTPHVRRFDFVLEPNRINRSNCAIVGYGNTLSITFSRVIRESELENVFFRSLVDMGIPVTIESNRG
jgi:hypothetical protein